MVTVPRTTRTTRNNPRNNQAMMMSDDCRLARKTGWRTYKSGARNGVLVKCGGCWKQYRVGEPHKEELAKHEGEVWLTGSEHEHRSSPLLR